MSAPRAIGLPTPLSVFVRPLIGAVGSRTFLNPALIWEAPNVGGEGPRRASSESPTGPGVLPTRPTAAEPLLYEVKKGSSTLNAMAIGITIGRTGNNDLCVDDDSVSRFHGYFQHDERSGRWSIIDAGSRNGIVAGGVRLLRAQPHLLAHRERLKIGVVEMTFYSPAELAKYVDQLLAG